MNFALSSKYSVIDFEDVSLANLLVIGGGCGGGGGSTTVTTASAQAAGQSAASAAGKEWGVYGVSIGDPVQSHDLEVRWRTSTPGGGIETGMALINTSTGTVVSSVVTHSSPSGGFWSSVGSFFSWLFSFGSH